MLPLWDCAALVLAGLAGMVYGLRKRTSQKVVRQVQAIIFDLDGTLIDYEGASHEALEAPLQRRGKTLSWDLHGKIVGTKTEDWSRKILQDVGLTPDILTPEAYVKEYLEDIKALYSKILAWPGTLPLLRSLKKAGFPMAIATSSPRVSFDQKMRYHQEILDLMDAVVTGDEVAKGKPAPDIFLEAARRLGKESRKCIVFEDSPLGVAGGQAAGCLTAALPDPRHSDWKPLFQGFPAVSICTTYVSQPMPPSICFKKLTSDL
ncbi:GPP1 [Symbiodinium natans]|uniref:GPP1 protein n=1 Tax=Symbiodinium natans TaxID=878477 RepID=A0A812SEZ2_9DINO|nr:GPP1 [Symbiodinium natans]